ncbi:MAG TPA: L,D-transpeptidase family protein [Ignavibacteria bacterium]|nr:L,D-transpeptidase family protein [Ignavibacteria bacterium]HQY52822.1 L,D-transpeptidase family protein [Ignavibacteria bacterium]
MILFRNTWDRFQSFLFILIAILISSNAFAEENLLKDSVNISGKINSEKMFFETTDISSSDDMIIYHMKEKFPIISESDLNKIISTKSVISIADPDTITGIQTEEKFKVSFYVPENFLVDSTKIFWELNIPEFQSKIYQLYNGQNIYIDTWPNVVGTMKDKTYTGNFEVYRVRNYPFYKDPDPKKAHLSPTPPGKGNPLGLFVVHYDENSLRYFHGNNNNKLLYSKMRNLSHGCVRNDNDNIEEMKQFIIKKVIKSEDLSGWLDSKKTLVYNLEESDKFPVKIIYKTYEIDKDNSGYYVTLFKDIYNYSSGRINETLNDPGLIFLSNNENLFAEYRKVVGNDISDDALNILVEYVLNKGIEYEKLYISDLKNSLSISN